MLEILLIVSVAAVVVFIGVLLIEGALRPGYRPTYHPGSALSLGDRGWIQIANFLQFGVGMVAFALAIRQTLNTVAGAVLMAIFGLGSIVAGVFRMDPMRGYPPGTPAGMPTELTWQHRVHELTGPTMFFTIFGACLVIAPRLQRPWRVYTVLTAVAGLALTVATTVAWHRDARNTGLIQRALLIVYCGWIGSLAMHLLNTER
jgi:hypothetical protein